MIANKIAFFIAVVLAVQVSSRTVYDDAHYKGIIDIAQSALEKLTEVVDAVIKSSQSTLDRMKQSVISLKDKFLTNATNKIQALADKLFDGLDELKNKANDAGVDIIECTQGKEGDLKQLPTQTLNDTGVCLTNSINGALSSLSQTLDDIQSTNGDLKELDSELGECKNSEHEFSCATGVVSKIVKATSELPAKVRGDLEKAREEVSQVPNELKKCLQDSYDAFTHKSKELVDDMAQCIKNKLSPSTAAPVTSTPSSSA